MENTVEELVNMSEEEAAAAALAIYRDVAFNGTVIKGWVWNEEKIAYVPPIDPPDTTYPYLWNEETESWDPFPGYPRD
jgi:hypothetical protein